MGRRRRRGRFEFRMRARVLSEPNVKPAEMPARVASPGVPSGRMPATEVAASGVASPASVLRFCGGEKTYHRQQDRKDVQRPHKEGSSSGHGPPTAGNVLTFYSRSPVRVVKLEETRARTWIALPEAKVSTSCVAGPCGLCAPQGQSCWALSGSVKTCFTTGRHKRFGQRPKMGLVGNPT